jgi:hypothetical protein
MNDQRGVRDEDTYGQAREFEKSFRIKMHFSQIKTDDDTYEPTCDFEESFRIKMHFSQFKIMGWPNHTQQ